MSFVPQLGASGIFTLVAPYDQLITPRAIYTVRSIRSLNDVLAAGQKPFEAYYQSVGLEKPAYDKDFKLNTPIIGLQSGIGEWVYVPSSYIARAPLTNGVKYTVLGLAMSLGPIPDAFNLEGLKAEMKDLVLKHIGVVTEVKGTMLTQPILIPEETHEQLERARLEKKTVNQASSSRITQLEQLLASSEARRAELEAWIIENRLA